VHELRQLHCHIRLRSIATKHQQGGSSCLGIALSLSQRTPDIQPFDVLAFHRVGKHAPRARREFDVWSRFRPDGDLYVIVREVRELLYDRISDGRLQSLAFVFGAAGLHVAAAPIKRKR